MKRITRIALLTVSTFVLAGQFLPSKLGTHRDSPDQQVVNAARQESEKDDAQLLAEFQRRIQKYVELHRRLEGPLPPLKVSDDPREICAAIDALARELRAARSKAKQGDIFTGDIARLFRRIISEALKGTDPVELLAMFAEENPNPTARPRVNASYPGSGPVAFMPPELLLVLPELPEELRYRFMHRALILWDYHASLIVDFIPNAIPLNESGGAKGF